MSLNFALIGNPNCGKTTLFNRLTGGNAHTGNFPGVTVEKRQGCCIAARDIIITDLPGIYSLSPYSPEEVISRRYIFNEKPDLIINIIDASSLVRSLYLTSQLTELDIPVIIALNMIDEAAAKGIKTDARGIALKLGIEVIPISAVTSEGIDLLIKKAEKAAKIGRPPVKAMLEETKIIKAAEKIRAVLGSAGKKITLFSAVKLLEGDKITEKELNLGKKELESIKAFIDFSSDLELEIACLRYAYIEKLVEKYTSKTAKPVGTSITDIIDSAATGRFSAFPVFFIIMLFIFYISFGPFGDFFSDLAESLLTDRINPFLESLAVRSGAGERAVGLICGGVIPGVGAVLSFLPRILILFFFLSLLEDSGYMARAAFILDKPLKKLGLSGKAFVPLLMGFGCTVPAVMAARTLEGEKSRKMTILLAPFMSCGARLPVYIIFASVFFPFHKGIVVALLYVIGIATAVLSAFFLSSVVFGDNSTDFLMELPPYRLPSAKTVLSHITEKTEEFVSKAFTVLLGASVVIWIMQNFDIRFNYIPTANAAQESILCTMGKILLPVFRPLGIKSPEACAALIAGLCAKEAIVSALGILYGGQTSLSTALRADFTPLSAFSFLVFVLLYTPCAAAFAAIKKELGSVRQTALALLFQTITAWLASFVIFRLSGFICGKARIAAEILQAVSKANPADIIISAAAAIIIIYNLYGFFTKKRSICKHCGKCSEDEKRS